MSASLLFLRQRTAKEAEGEHATLDVVEHEGDLCLHPHRDGGGACGIVHVQEGRTTLNAVRQILEVEGFPGQKAVNEAQIDGDRGRCAMTLDDGKAFLTNTPHASVFGKDGQADMDGTQRMEGTSREAPSTAVWGFRRPQPVTHALWRNSKPLSASPPRHISIQRMVLDELAGH